MNPAGTLADLIRGRAASGLPAIVRPGHEEPEVVPWRDVAADAGAVALALLQGGLEAREAVAFFVRCPERAVSALFGTWLAGGIVTFLDPDGPPDSVAAALAHSECRFAFVDGPPGDHAPVLATMSLVQDLGPDLAMFLDAGREQADLHRVRAERRIAELEPGDIACYAYRSGAAPGGGMGAAPGGGRAAPLAAKLTHGGMLAAGAALGKATGLDQGDRILSVLSPWHPAQRAVEIAACVRGAALCATGAPDPGATHLLQGCPTILAAPYIEAETMARRILHSADQGGALHQRTWHWALDAGMADYRKKMAARGAKPHPSWQGRLAHRFGLDGALDPFGGALRLLLCTGSTPSAFARDLFGALGVGLMSLYVLIEASGPAAASDPRDPGPAGDVGAALDSAELQVADDGEILVRGRSLFAGYLKEPGLTGRALLGGWFRTGDRGERDGDHIRLLGPVEAERGLMVRVTAVEVEAALRGQPAIVDAIAVPGKPWVALVVPAGELLRDVAERSGIDPDEAMSDPRVEEAIAQAIVAHNGSAEFEGRVMAYAIVPSLPRRGLGVPDRKGAARTYAALLDAPVPAPMPDLW